MKYLVTSEEMKKYDTYTINEIGISADVLMERAALYSTRLIERYCSEQGKSLSEVKVLIAAGCGNNGGDGLAVGRLLSEKNAAVDVCLIGNREKISPECAKQLAILEKYGVVPSPFFPEREYDIIVDALFGIGLTREVSGDYLTAIEKINCMKAWKLSLDIPSGVDATTGKVWGAAVQADVTATFAYKKRGLYLYPGAAYAGEICVGDIGITHRSFDGVIPEMFTYESAVEGLLPKRNPAGNKGTFGKVLILAGSKSMPGAMILCAKAAFRAGAGMVKVISHENNGVFLQKTVPEAMFEGYDDTVAAKETNPSSFSAKLCQSIKWADCLLAGPGLGTDTEAKAVLERFINETAKPLVLDADALNLLSAEESLQKSLLESILATGRKVILTPHAGELSRLLKRNTGDVKENLTEAAREAAKKYECIMVCKDARTVVCGKEGPVYLNTSGNSGMATAGSGDVLAGILAALCAEMAVRNRNDGSVQGKEVNHTLFTAALGVYLHGKCGDYVAQSLGETAVMASDIIEALCVIQRGNEDGKDS